MSTGRHGASTETLTTDKADFYRTRVTGLSGLKPRLHPVVWGDGVDGSLAADQVASYDSRGYHTADAVLSSSDVDACVDEVTALTERLASDERVVRESSDGSVRSVFDVHKLSDVVAEICARPDIVDVARQILDDDVYIHQSRINFKPGFAGGPFYWHSDFETWHAEDGMPVPRALSVSLALTPNHAYNGSLMIIPGSHKVFVSCPGETPDGYHRQSLSSYRPPFGTPDEKHVASLADEMGIDTVTGPAGSALYFDSNCLHASSGNITPFPRSNLFVVFNSRSNRLRDPYGAATPRPDYLANR
jgi:ectoine hydroxylase